MSNGPNPLKAAWNMLYARRLNAPRPVGTGEADHAPLVRVLDRMKESGVHSLTASVADLEVYRDRLAQIDPDQLSVDGSLAYWINMYNAGALHRAAQAYSLEYGTVLRIPGAFSAPWATVAGETMSLDDIEHGKIRRFGDPRIHGALVCGSVSCPTLRGEPFTADGLGNQLDDQMQFFLANGGGSLDRTANVLHLSRVLKWYGSDFVRPASMPTLRPARPIRIVEAIRIWLTPEDVGYVDQHQPGIEFAPYDWGLGCSVA